MKYSIETLAKKSNSALVKICNKLMIPCDNYFEIINGRYVPKNGNSKDLLAHEILRNKDYIDKKKDEQNYSFKYNSNYYYFGMYY